VSRRRRHIGITVYGITGFSICLITTSFIRVARCGFKRLLCVKLRVCCAFAGEAKSHWSEPVVIELNKQITNVFLDTLYRIRYILRRSRCWNPESPNRSSHHSGLKLLQCKNVSCSAFLIRHYHTRINDAFLFYYTVSNCSMVLVTIVNISKNDVVDTLSILTDEQSKSLEEQRQ
jgi:hypothetical protein